MWYEPEGMLLQVFADVAVNHNVQSLPKSPQIFFFKNGTGQGLLDTL